ncbi:MAG: competence/damage-inducible protein A [Actinomycetota bacterium]|nr:competence/damage-inducible protein A [Actinomycetota bacterium]
MPDTSAEVVAVGSELLLGEHVDTNSAWISSRLAEVGVDVYRHTTVGDNVGRMVDALREACARARTVIVTGGLGPTADDLTRVAVARLANVELQRHDEIVAYLYEHFRRGGRQMPASNLLQADIPAGARVLEPVGTAPGFAIDVDGSTVWCVPGVPREMTVMVARDVIPALQRLGAAAATVSRVVRTSGIAESAVDEACAAVTRRLEATGNPTLAFLASRGETRVRLTAKAPDRDAALALLDPLVDELLELLGANVVGVDDEGVESAVARQLRRLGLTLAVAESITGGGVGARLVTVPGASDWFAGGVVTYATETKSRLADVDPSLLEAFGPVSQETAVALANGARARLAADVGLAVVGVAGPTTQGGQPVGLTWVAATLPDGSWQATSRRLPARSRPDVQEFAVSMALDFLRRQLAELS